MKRHEQESVLEDKKNIAGLPSDKKSSVEKARAGKISNSDCDNALDGPACIDGVPQDKKSK